MTDYSSATPQNFNVNDLTGGPVYTNGFVNTGGNGTFSSPYAWQAASTTESTGHFTLHYWRSGSTNNWGHVSRSDITTSIQGTTITVKLSNVDQFTFTESDAFVAPGPTPDEYGRLPSTAISKTVNLGRISYRASIPGENVITDPVPTPIVGGYQTYNFPSAIFCPRPRTTFAEAETDRLLFENNKQNYARNGILYGPYIFGGCLPNVLSNIYTYVELRASAPFQFNSNGDWYINYTTHAFKPSVPDIVEIITGFAHNPAHSVLLRYNITTNTWIGVLANIDETIYTSAGSQQYTNKKLTLQSVSPSSTQQWNGFSNLSNTTVNLIEFFVDVDTNIGSSSTPTQPEVEVASTTSNEGGKRRRYPIISTNLFDRQRSIYSIGLTHKDDTLF